MTFCFPPTDASAQGPLDDELAVGEELLEEERLEEELEDGERLEDELDDGERLDEELELDGELDELEDDLREELDELLLDRCRRGASLRVRALDLGVPLAFDFALGAGRFFFAAAFLFFFFIFSSAPGRERLWAARSGRARDLGDKNLNSIQVRIPGRSAPDPAAPL